MSGHVETGWKSAAAAGGSLDRPIDVPSAIKARRSTKQFKPDPLPPGVLERLVELTVAAPSSFNVQDWRIVVVTSPEQRQALAAAAYNQPQVLVAPATFVFAADTQAGGRAEHVDAIIEQAAERGAWPDKVVEYYRGAIPGSHAALGAKQREYAIKGAMLAAAHLMIAAASMGLDTSPMNGWVEDEVKKVIGAGDDPNIAIAVLVSVGFGEGGLGNPGRLPISKTVSIDRLDNPFPG
jgi:nitroreductase